MPRTLAKGHTRLMMFKAADIPADLSEITVTEFADAIDLSCIVLKENYKFGAVASDTVNQDALCQESNTSIFDASNFEVSAWFFRYLIAGTGLPDPTDDVAWTELKTKGTEVVLVERRGPKSGVAMATGQEYLAIPVMADNPMPPDDQAGYQRFGQSFAITGDGVYGKVVAT